MAGPSFTFRAAQDGDVEELLALWSLPDVHPTVTDTADAVLSMMRQRPDSVIVAQDQVSIVGTVIVGWDGWRGSLYRLVVSPAARRQGIGTALVSHALAVLRDLGCSRAGILVVEADASAVAFWNRCAELGIVVDPAPKARYISNLT